MNESYYIQFANRKGTPHMGDFFGFFATMLFAAGQLPMVIKAIRTRDVHSYSPVNLVICNMGNALYWIYVVGLPFGPVWFLHAFNTVMTATMLVCYVMFETRMGR